MKNILADVLNETLTEELACASLYVDANLNIVHVYGNINAYISFPTQSFSTDLQKMRPDSIVIAIDSAIQKLQNEKQTAVYKEVLLKQTDRLRKITILIKSFQVHNDADNYYLIVLFERNTDTLINKKAQDITIGTKGKGNLDMELKETKELLKLITKELEATSEELETANRELQHIKDDNKELERLNKKLSAANNEYKKKIQQQATLNADVHNMFNSTKTGAIFLSEDLRIRAFTPLIKNQFNLLPSDVGRPIGDFINVLGNMKIAEDAFNVLASGAQIEKEIERIREYYIMRILPYKNNSGSTDGVVITFIDNTNLVTIRKALATSKRSFDAFMEHSPLITWIKNERGEYIYVNKSFEDHFNVSRKLVVGKTHETIYPKETALELGKKLEALLNNWELSNNEEKIVRNQQTFIYRTVRFPFIGLDERRYIGGISKNITEQRKAEERLKRSEAMLKAAQEIAQVGSWEIDFVPCKHEWSDELYRLLGIIKDNQPKPATELFLSFVHPEDKISVSSKLDSLRSCSSNISFDFRFIKKDGEIKYACSEWRIEFDGGNKAIRAYGIVMDITERKKSEQEKIKMLEDIVQRNKNLEQFSYIVSHNLRSPVANILGLCNLLQANRLKIADQQAINRSLSDSVAKLDEVIIDLNNILNIKRKISEKKVKVSFTKLTKDVCLSIQSMLDKKKAEIVCDFVNVDEIITLKSYIHSIFYNLISNSVKYHRPDVSPIIKISSRKDDEGITLVFEDNGLGIDLEKKGNQVFGLYKRFHLDKAEGKGMGLFLVRTQVEAIGGRISIQSKINNGTKFTIRLKTEK